MPERFEVRTAWLRHMLEALGLSQNEAARLICTEPRTLRRWCDPSGKTPPPWVVCDYFHCMVSQRIPTGHVLNRNAFSTAKAPDDASP